MDEQQDQPLILIVDDKRENLQLLGKILSKNGYKVSAAKNGEQALMLLKKIDPDLVLLDIMMPNVDGYEVCEKIQSNDEIEDLPVIFLTGKTEKEDIVAGFEAGAVDYITKPFNGPELLARVETHIELKRARETQRKLNKELEDKLKKIKTLKGLVPICANCKKIRDDKGYWNEVEEYVGKHSDAEFSHGLCPNCMEDLYPEQYKKMKERERQENEAESEDKD